RRRAPGGSGQRFGREAGDDPGGGGGRAARGGEDPERGDQRAAAGQDPPAQVGGCGEVGVAAGGRVGDRAEYGDAEAVADLTAGGGDRGGHPGLRPWHAGHGASVIGALTMPDPAPNSRYATSRTGSGVPGVSAV